MVSVEHGSKPTPSVTNSHKDFTATKTLAALICVGISALLWVTMAFVVHDAQTTFPNPFCITWVVHGGYSVCIIPWVVWYLAVGRKSTSSSGESSWRSLIWKSLFLNILSFCCTYSWYISVPLTSVAGNTAVYNSCCVFVFLLSVFVLGEDFSAMKMFSVILCVCGAISVSVLGANEETESDWPLKWRAIGYGLVFVSMICYATYQVFYKKFSISESPWCSVNILWLVGLWDIAMFPLVVGISWFEIEPISWPGWYVIRSIAFMTLLDALFGLLTVVAITLSSPLLVSCTSLMTIPTAILADIVFLHKTLPVFAFVGVAAIVAGFLAFNLETFVEARRAKYKLISSLPPRANQTYNSV